MPSFKKYLERHVYLDGDFHGPMAEKMLINLLKDDAKSYDEAFLAASHAV